MPDSSLPETRYAQSGDLSIAYQVFGHGSRDLVYVPGILSHVELAWEDPYLSDFLSRLGEVFRVIIFDKRGQGMSDRTDGVPTLEERIDDLKAVMQAAESDGATIFGISEGGPMSILFAAGHPEKVERLVLFGAMARFVAAEDYPHRPPLDRYIDDFISDWGKGALASLVAPDDGHPEGYAEFIARFERMSSSPSAMRKFLAANKLIDVRPILPDLQPDTLVIHRRGDRTVVRENGRYLADNIPGAIYLELPGRSHFPWLGNSDLVLDALTRFAEVGAPQPIHEDLDQRRLATALFTDIAQSTAQLAAMGDRRWGELLDQHDRLTQSLVSEYRGRIVKTTGDGLLALFDGPARALRCAERMVSELDGIGLAIRAGLHVGEVVGRGDDVTGLAVNIAARVMGEAGAGDVFLTRTLMELTGGSGIAFEPVGTYELAGVPGAFELFRPVARVTPNAASVDAGR